MYTNFQNSCYVKDIRSILSKENFINFASLVFLVCSEDNKSLKNTPVDVRLGFETKVIFSELTTAYCLVIHHRIIEYNPMTGDVRKLT